MKNSNLISTVIYAQVLLIFISFKIPDSLHKKGVLPISKTEHAVVNVSENVTSIILEKATQGEVNGINYNFNYPSISAINNKRHSLFNSTVLNKIDDGKLKIGFGEATSDLCNQTQAKQIITNQYSDFKVYNENESYISLLLLKADYLNSYTYPEYSFHTINYNLQSKTLIEFDDLFTANAKDEFLKLLNSSHNKLGDCKLLSASDFEKYKNNFVFNASAIKFYFDECLMCKDHHREYAIEIPLNEIDKSMLLNTILK